MACWPAPTYWSEMYELGELATGLYDLFEEYQAWKTLRRRCWGEWSLKEAYPVE
jgi:hypothetical protein